MRRVGKRWGLFSWLWANPLALAAVILIIVLIVALYIRNELAEAKEAEKLRRK
jgi:hypothetical protein